MKIQGQTVINATFLTVKGPKKAIFVVFFTQSLSSPGLYSLKKRYKCYLVGSISSLLTRFGQILLSIFLAVLSF